MSAITVAIELRNVPARIKIRDEFNYNGAGWDMADVSVVVVVTGPAGSIYDNIDYDAPDIEPAISRDLNKIINLPMDPETEYRTVLKGNYTVKVSRYNSVLDLTEETLLTYSYTFDPPTITNRTISGPYSGILKSEDTTDYGDNIFIHTRQHTIKYPTQLDPPQSDVVSGNAIVNITPIYTNNWTIEIYSYIEYRNPDELIIYWEDTETFTHCVYGGCIDAMYQAIKTMLTNYYNTWSYQVVNQEAYQKRLVTVNTAWHLLNIAYQNNDVEEADYQSAIIQEQVAYTGSGTCGGATSILVVPCLPYSGSPNADYTFSNGLTEVGGAVKLGGVLAAETTINAGAYALITSGTSGSQSVLVQTSYAGHIMTANSSTQQGEVSVLGTKVSLAYNDLGTPANSRRYDIGSGGIVEAADYSAGYTDRSLISKAFFDANSDWGSQVVVTDASLTGSGIAADPLSIASPFPGFGTLLSDYGYVEPTHSFDDLTSHPTTLLGYGITDATVTFIALTDTPASYLGQAGKFLKVNATTDGIEFASTTGFVPDTGGTFTGQVIILTSNDYPLVLKQSGSGGSAGTPEAGKNMAGFQDGDGDLQGEIGIDASGNLSLDTFVAGGVIYAKKNLSVIGDIVLTGVVDGVDIAALKTAYDSHAHTFASLTSKPTTMSGFGLVDAMSNQTDMFRTEFVTKVAGEINDILVIEDSADGYAKKYVKLSDIPPAATTFISLSDTPSTYSGQGLKFSRVNTGATGLEFVDIGSLYISTTAGTFNTLTEKANPTPTDVLIIEDSADGYAQRKVLIGNLPSTAGGSGVSLTFRYDTVITDADPGIGRFRLNSATPASVTYIYIDYATWNNVTLSAISSFLNTNDIIYIQQISDATKSILFSVTGPAVDGTGYYKIPVSYVDDSGVIMDNNQDCGFIISNQNIQNLTGVVTSVGLATSIADAALSIAKTSGLQSALDGKAATLSGTINEIAYFNSSSTIASLAVATYPSLTELSYIKGVTSAIQTQLNAKAPVASPTFTGTVTAASLIVSDITTGYVPYQTATVFTDSPIYTDGAKIIIGGTTSSIYKLDIIDNGVSTTGVRTVHIGASDPLNGAAFIVAANDGAAMSLGDRLGSYVFSGAEDASGSFHNGAIIAGYAAEAWSITANGTYISIGTTAIGATSRTERMRIGPGAMAYINGGLHVGGTSDAGDNNLLVDGATTITGLTGTGSRLILTSDVGLLSASSVTFDGTYYRFVSGANESLVGYGSFGIVKSGVSKMYFDPMVADGAGALPYYFNTDVALVTSGALLAGFYNNSVLKLSIDKDGGITSAALAGTGTRMVTASTTGLLSTAALPVTPVADILNWSTNKYTPYADASASYGKFYLGTTLVTDWDSRLNYTGGLYVNASANTGLYGKSVSNHGVSGRSTDSYGVNGFSDNSYGVYGASTNSHGVVGVTSISAKAGVLALSSLGYSIWADKTSSLGAADTSAVLYLYRHTTNTIHNQSGNIIDIMDNPTTTSGVISGSVLKAQIGGANVKIDMNPRVVDGATAIAYLFDTTNNLTTAGARLLSLKNSTNEKFYVGYNGDMWTAGDCSALTFTDRTPFYKGNALEEILRIKGKRGGIDHSTLPEFVRRDLIIGKKTEPGRDIGAMVSVLTVAVQQLAVEEDEKSKQIRELKKRVSDLEEEIKNYR